MLASIHPPLHPALISSDHVGNFPYTILRWGIPQPLQPSVHSEANERGILLELFSTRGHLPHRKNNKERLLNAVLLCDKIFSLETEHTCLPIPDREPLTDQSMDIKV